MSDKKCCGCILAGRKFINQDGSINYERFSKILERWFQEMKSLNIHEEIAFNTIVEYRKLNCQCDCHKIK